MKADGRKATAQQREPANKLSAQERQQILAIANQPEFAHRLVKANAGSAGVDRQSIAAFERDLKGNLYTLWNRMSSGSYLPPSVLAVAIPKKSGGERLLGVPTLTAHCTF